MGRIIPKGLATTLDPSLIDPSALQAACNCTVDQGVIEGRAGFAEVWKRTGHSSADVLLGAGFGRYNGTEVFAYVIKHSGYSYGVFYVYNLTTGTEISYYGDPDGRWNNLADDEWHFHQQGAYLYAVCETDTAQGRFWRWRIEGTDSDDWQRVPILYSDFEVADSDVAWNIPNPGYEATDWNTSILAGAVVSPPVATALIGSVDPALLASVDGGRLKLYRATDGSARGWYTQFAHYNFTSALDLKVNRHWYIEAELSMDPAATRPNQEPYFDLPSRVVEVWINTDSAATNIAPTTANGWVKVRAYVSVIEANQPYYHYATKIGITVMFDRLQLGDTGTDYISNIRKLCIALPMASGNKFSLSVSAPVLGGTFMSKPSKENYLDGNTSDYITDPAKFFGNALKPIEYATVSYNGSDESDATFARLTGSNAVGLPQVPGVPPLGSGSTITVPSPSGAYTGVRVFRKRHSDSSQWHCIYEGSGGESVSDYRVDAVDDILDWQDSAHFTDLPATPIARAESYDWGTQTAAFTGQCITSWKGHMVIGSGTEVYFSYQGDPTRYLRPVRSRVNYTDDVDDPTLGRTLYMSNTIGDKVLALVAQDALYAVGTEGVYAMVGDSAVEASEFRKLPGTVGAINGEAVCGYEDGVLVANQSGIYYVRVSRLGQALEQTSAVNQELTLSNRGMWRLFMASGAPNDVVLRAVDGEIRCYRGPYEVRRTRSGQWEYHKLNATALASGATSAPANAYGTPVSLPTAPTRGLAVTRGSAKSSYTGFSFTTPTPSASLQAGVQWLHWDTKIGTYFFSRSGKLFRMDRDSSGVAYTTDANYAIPYAAVFADVGKEKRSRLMRYMCVTENRDSGNTSGAVRIGLEEFDGSTGSKVYVSDKAQTAAELNSTAFSSQGGWFHSLFVASGNSAQRVVAFGADYVAVDAGRGT